MDTRYRPGWMVSLLVGAGLSALASQWSGVIWGKHPPHASLLSPWFAWSRVEWEGSREVQATVDSLRTASMAYHAAFGAFEEAPTFPRPHDAVDQQPVEVDPAIGREGPGYLPDGPLWGAYTVLVREDGRDFLVVGSADTDVDGRPVVWAASSTLTPVQVTAETDVR